MTLAETPVMTSPEATASDAAWLQVRGSRYFTSWLAEQRISLALTTYQTGKLFLIALYVPRAAFTTGDLDIHDVVVEESGRVVFVATHFNCLATISERTSFTPLWRPSFVRALVPEDRCHLNGLAMRDGRARQQTEPVQRGPPSRKGAKIHDTHRPLPAASSRRTDSILPLAMLF